MRLPMVFAALAVLLAIKSRTTNKLRMGYLISLDVVQMAGSMAMCLIDNDNLTTPIIFEFYAIFVLAYSAWLVKLFRPEMDPQWMKALSESNTSHTSILHYGSLVSIVFLELSNQPGI